MRDKVFENVKPMLKDSKLNLKDLKIAELDKEELAILFDEFIGLYLGRKNNMYFPLLRDELVLSQLPSAFVDMGAIKFVTNGANVMRPGIVSFSGEFQKGELVVVKDIAHQKAIAVTRALGSKDSLESMKKGAALENLHYVGDGFWEALKDLKEAKQ